MEAVELGNSLCQIGQLTGLTIGQATGLTLEDLNIILQMRQEGYSLEQISQEVQVRLEVLNQFCQMMTLGPG
jgi:predicted transposase YdaD